MTKGEKTHNTSNWKSLLLSVTGITVIYGILSVAMIFIMLNLFLPFAKSIMPENWAAYVTAGLTILFISPFLRAMIMKKVHSEEVKALVAERAMNYLPLTFIELVRLGIAAAFIFYICQKLIHPSTAILITAIFVIVGCIIGSKTLKKRSRKLEEMFVQNLRSRDIAAQARGEKKPGFEGKLLDRNLHITDFEVPENSLWTGKKLKDLSLRQKYGVQVSSILRSGKRINIPSGNDILFPMDKLQVIGNDEELTAFNKAITSEVFENTDDDPDKHLMKLRTIAIPETSPLVGKTLKNSGLSQKYGCMLVGLEEGQQELTTVSPDYVFQAGDIIWIVGEEESLKQIESN